MNCDACILRCLNNSLHQEYITPLNSRFISHTAGVVFVFQRLLCFEESTFFCCRCRFTVLKPAGGIDITELSH